MITILKFASLVHIGHGFQNVWNNQHSNLIIHGKTKINVKNIQSPPYHHFSIPLVHSPLLVHKLVDLKQSPRIYQTSLFSASISTSPSTILTNVLSSSPLSLPLIKREDTWGNIAILAIVSSLSQSVVAPRTRIGSLLGAPVTAMAIAFLLGSIQILPSGGSPGAKVIQSLSLQLATPLLLLSTDLKKATAKDTCGPLLQAFIYASIGTLFASMCAMLTPVGSMLLHIGAGTGLNGMNDGIKIAAALMAKNIGGGINYIAVCQTLQASPNAIAAGLCVDNIYALLYFPITSALAKGRPDLKLNSTPISSPSDQTNENDNRTNNISVEDLSTALAFASISTWIGEKVGGRFSASLPCSTLFTILLTTILPKSANKKSNQNKIQFPESMTLKNLRPAGEVLGTSLLYLFFATAGAPGLAIASSVRASFIPISLFLLCLYSGHAAFLFAVKYLYHWKESQCNKGSLDQDEMDDGPVAPQRLLVASSAAIGGPATAAALAQANGWNSLIGPSLLVGNLGYAVATFLGIAFYSLFKQ